MKNISFKCKIYRSKSWKKVSLGLLKKKAIGIYESIKKKQEIHTHKLAMSYSTSHGKHVHKLLTNFADLPNHPGKLHKMDSFCSITFFDFYFQEKRNTKFWNTWIRLNQCTGESAVMTEWHHSIVPYCEIVFKRFSLRVCVFVLSPVVLLSVQTVQTFILRLFN